MKIYAFDDKEVNAANAERAILDAGHTCGVHGGFTFWEQHDIALRFHKRGGVKESSALRVYREMFDMVEHAIADAKANGGGIVTDLMFHLSPPRDSETDNQPPAGLLLALRAIAQGVPVVICTNAEEVGGHHAKEISWIFDGYVTHLGRNCAFGWVENKDWHKAVNVLEEMSAR